MTRHHEEEEKVDPLHAFIQSVMDSPMKYIGSLVLIVVLVAAGFLINVSKIADEQSQATDFAVAVDIEDPAERAAALAVVANANGKYAAEALLLQGASALDANDFDSAKMAYSKLAESHPTFEFTPDAVEGLGVIAQEQGDYAEAIVQYKKVQETWPDSFTAKRQPYNIAVCHEKNEAYTEAIAAYKEQLEEFVGSTVAMQAQLKLDQLYADHPELAPVEEAVVPEVVVPEVVSPIGDATEN